MSRKKAFWLTASLALVLLGLLAAVLLRRGGVPSPAAATTAPPTSPPPPTAATTEEPAPPPDSTPFPTPAPEAPVEEAEAILRAFLAEQPGRWSLCWTYLPTGDSVALSSDDEPMISASLIKLFIMGAVFERTKEDALEGEAAAPLLRAMITVSDNKSANELIGLLGGGDTAAGMAAVNDWCARRGYEATRLNRLMLEDNGLQNYTSAADCAKLLQELYLGVGFSEEASRQMLALLTDQRVNDRLPALLPPGTSVAHKTGDLVGLCCGDAGIVWSPGGDYILCAVCNDPPRDNTARDAIAELSRQIYALVNEQ